MNTVIIGARGDRACFTTPSVSKQSRFSYPFISPSAAKGLLVAIFAKPEFEWCIRRIAIMALGETDVIRVNEVKFPENAEPFVASDNRCQVTMRILRFVDYIIEAYPVVTNPGPSDKPPNTVQKYLAQFNKRIYGNKPFHANPCFGLREFSASIYDVVEFPERGSPDVADFEVPGMLIGWSHGNQRKDNGPSYPYFRDVRVRNGIVDVPRFVGSELKVGE